MKSLALAGVLAFGLATFQAPIGLLAASHAKPSKPPKPDNVFRQLQDATKQAAMKGKLRGDLASLLESARRDWKAGRDQDAGEKLLDYIEKLTGQKGNQVTPEVADSLIEAANDLIDDLFPYPFAADYDRVSLGASLSPRVVVDWRTKGVVTSVKNQGSCHSDYAFSATGVMEAAHALNSGALIPMAAQQIVDCDQESFGCDGGSPVRAIEYVIGRQPDGGLDTESSYPYTGVVGSCRANVANTAAKFTSLARITPGNETALVTALNNGLVSVVLRIRTSAWDNYTDTSGVLDEPAEREGLPRYIAALAVGYTDQYWIVKTSNGSDFGHQGYVWVSRGTNAFGIANFAVVPED